MQPGATKCNLTYDCLDWSKISSSGNLDYSLPTSHQIPVSGMAIISSIPLTNLSKIIYQNRTAIIRGMILLCLCFIPYIRRITSTGTPPNFRHFLLSNALSGPPDDRDSGRSSDSLKSCSALRIPVHTRMLFSQDNNEMKYKHAQQCQPQEDLRVTLLEVIQAARRLKSIQYNYKL